MPRIDTHKLDNLFSSAKLEDDSKVGKTSEASLVDADTEKVEANLTESSILGADTQAINNTLSMTDSYLNVNSCTKEKIRSKMNDSEIIQASTQVLMSKLDDSAPINCSDTRSGTPLMTDSLILAASTQVNDVGDNVEVFDDEEDDLLLAATQPVFKQPLMRPTKKSSNQSLKIDTPDLLAAETAPVEDNDLLEADTAQLAKEDLLEAETAPIDDHLLQAETVPIINDDILSLISGIVSIP